MPQKLILDFGGWIELDLDATEFCYMGIDDKRENVIIRGAEYLKLPENERKDYILYSLVDAISTALDGETEILDVSIHED